MYLRYDIKQPTTTKHTFYNAKLNILNVLYIRNCESLFVERRHAWRMELSNVELYCLGTILTHNLLCITDDKK
jgi:hypothetical protein